MSADWAMVFVTIIYVVATIFISWANIKSADVNEIFIKEYPQLIDEKSRARLNKRELK